jgi:alpha-methylacyl-CoA racemase
MSVLSGITVLELGRVPPTEVPGMIFASFGADVIKIDTPTDVSALTADERETTRHAPTNQGKRSIALDLKAAQGQKIFERMAETADVIIEGFRPGVMKRLNADYETVVTRNPRVVYCSMSGFGQIGPYRLRPAHDLNFLALSGVLDLIRDKTNEPVIPLNLIADYGGASMHSALAILLALFERERTGTGQYIDISYLETTIALLALTPNFRELAAGRRMPVASEGIFSGTYPYYTTYVARDGRSLSVACSEPALWRNFCETIGCPQLGKFARSPAHYRRQADAEEAAAKAKVASVILGKSSEDWEAIFEGRDVCVARLNSVEEMLVDRQLEARGFVAEPGGASSPSRAPTLASALRLSRSMPSKPKGLAPLPGEHTRALLSEYGFTTGMPIGC